METKFKNEIISNLEKDVKDQKEILKKEKEELIKINSLPKNEIKPIKKEWKRKRKEVKNKISDYNKNIKIINNKINELSGEKSLLETKYDDVYPVFAYDAEQLILYHYQEDMKIIKSLDITPMATKVKILNKDYGTESVGRNPRIGMSLGTNFKPRFYISGSVQNKTKTVLLSKEQFDIRKKDDFENRVQEIAEILEIKEASLLYDHIMNIMTRAMGSQYIQEFLN